MRSPRLLAALAILLIAGLAGFSAPGYAGDIRRCTIGGRTILTDQPCDDKELQAAAAPARAEATQALEFQRQRAHRFYGQWYGPVGMHVNGDVMGGREGRRALVQAQFTIGENGQIKGVAAETGCRFKGSAAWDELLETLAIDMVAEDCKPATLNGRYSGLMQLPGDGAAATLDLRARIFLGQPARWTVADLRATLHR